MEIMEVPIYTFLYMSGYCTQRFYGADIRTIRTLCYRGVHNAATADDAVAAEEHARYSSASWRPV